MYINLQYKANIVKKKQMRQTNFVIARLSTFHHNIVISNQFISYSILK